MATAITPVYSVYVDTRNTYRVGIHKIRLNAQQLQNSDTYTWSVPRLAPSSSSVGNQLSLENQFPNLAYPTNGGGASRNLVSAYVGSSAYSTLRNDDGSLDLIYVTLHEGTVNT